jgi:CRP-like cAMP-binding protein
MLAQWPEGLGAIAEADTTVLEIDADDFYDVIEDHFNLVYITTRNMARTMLKERREIADGTYLAPAEGILECPDRELDLIERLLFLQKGTPLAETNVDSLIEIARTMEEHRFAKGEVLWEPGDPSGFVYMIVGGTAECTVENTGRRFRVGAGYPMGNLESMAAEPRWYTPVAEKKLLVLRGETDAFLDLLEDHFEMTQAFLAAMAKGIISVQSQRREAILAANV